MEGKLLSWIFGPKTEELNRIMEETVQWETHNFNSSLNIIRYGWGM